MGGMGGLMGGTGRRGGSQAGDDAAKDDDGEGFLRAKKGSASFNVRVEELAMVSGRLASVRTFLRLAGDGKMPHSAVVQHALPALRAWVNTERQAATQAQCVAHRRVCVQGDGAHPGAPPRAKGLGGGA